MNPDNLKIGEECELRGALISLTVGHGKFGAAQHMAHVAAETMVEAVGTDGAAAFLHALAEEVAQGVS